MYDQAGNIIKTETKTLPAKGQEAFIAGDGSDKRGWIEIKSDQKLTGLCFFGDTQHMSYMADITMISELSAVLHVPHVAQNAQWDTSVMVCNPGTSGSDVTLAFVDTKGIVIAEKTYSVSAGGSGVYQLADLLGEKEYTGGSVEISSEQGIAAFALYTDLKTKWGMSFAGISAVNPNK